MQSPQQRLEEAMNEWQNMQREIEKIEQNKQKLDTQLRENEMVKKELDLVEADSTVYKLIGPCLIKQDPSEASVTVAKRIEYLGSEIKRLDAVGRSEEAKMVEKKKQIMELQNKVRAGGR
eukprot:TRINITY_DN14249_c0_g1_i1.p2 TRINITY_DN14249_c0_g1~~TRINITY_DN14249_c0_g1_i1.p2  ORF type:complete len:130 (+),score=39.19 TRINITY_DN14249_c0_g1_i1:33-392(+)